MILNTKGVNIDPGSLNSWLQGHDGYADGCDIVWGSVDAFKVVTFIAIETADYDTICSGVEAGHGIIANVRDNTHWVLITGCKGDGTTFYVNDPYFDVSTYTTSDVSQEAVYH